MRDDPYFISPFDFNDFLDNDNKEEDFSFQITTDDVKRYCAHEWVEVGFMHSKLVCKKCDLEKKDWEEFQANEKLKEEAKKNSYFI